MTKHEKKNFDISVHFLLSVYFEQNDTTDVESNNGTEVSEIPEDDSLLDNDNDDQEQRKPPLRYLQASDQWMASLQLSITFVIFF